MTMQSQPATRAARQDGASAPQQRPEQLERVRERLQTVLQGILWEADSASLRFTFISNSAVEVLGYPIEDWTADATFWADHLHPDDRARATNDLRRAVKKGEDLRLEYRMIAADGRVVWLRDHAFVLDLDERRAGRGDVRGFMLNISDSKRTERRLEAQYNVSRALAESGTIEDAAPRILCGIGESLGLQVGNLWLIDSRSDALVLIETWDALPSHAAAPFIEATRALALRQGQGLPGHVAESAEPVWMTDIANEASFNIRRPQAERAGLRSGFAFPIKLGDQLLGIMEFLSTAPLAREPELIDALASVGHQIGQFIEHKRAEDLLRLSELRYKTLFEGNIDAVFSFDLSGCFTSANPACEEVSGYAIDELIGMPFTELVVKDDLASAMDRFVAVLQGEPQNVELSITHKEGRQVRVNVTGIPIIVDGKTSGVFGIAKDVTERRQQEDALRESESRLKLALEAGQMGAWEWNIQSGIVHWSEALERIHGLEPGTFAGTFEAYCSDVHPDDLDRLIQNIDASVSLGEHEVEYRIIPPNGQTRWVSGKGRVVRDVNGTPMRMIGVCMDITERRLAEEQLRAALEAKDEFLGMISHELRTPITTIYGGARLLRYRAGELDDESASSVIEDIEHETERLHRIVEDLLVLSRLALDNKLATEPVLLQHLVERAAEAFRRRMRPVDVQVAADLAAVAGEPTYLEQVLRNLLSNADKYSPAGLPIEINVRQSNDEIIVSVIDHGPGIEAEERDRIFDRFYRSSNAKAVSGAGIGLTVCKRLIDAQSGRIWAGAADDGGLEVSFALPRFREDSE